MHFQRVDVKEMLAIQRHTAEDGVVQRARSSRRRTGYLPFPASAEHIIRPIEAPAFAWASFGKIVIAAKGFAAAALGTDTPVICSGLCAIFS